MRRAEILPAQALPEPAKPEPAKPEPATSEPALPQPSRRAVCLGLAACVGLAGCSPSAPAALPPVALPRIAGLTRFGWDVPGIAADQFRGRVSVLNVWASWCPYCRGEHDVLMRLSQDRQFALVGLVHLDNEANALAYAKAGNPFSAVAVDASASSACCRDFGRSRVLVVDSAGCPRAGGRPPRHGRRRRVGVDPAHARGDFDHLVMVSSMPVFLSPGVHYLEAWSEAVCAGAWGRQAAKLGEKLRRASTSSTGRRSSGRSSA